MSRCSLFYFIIGKIDLDKKIRKQDKTCLLITLAVYLVLSAIIIIFTEPLLKVMVTLLLLYKQGINLFNKEQLDFKWSKDFFKIGGISGVESFVRNIFYMIMISRMVNMVGEQGTYWVANNFIW